MPDLLLSGNRFSVLRWITIWRDLLVSAEFQEKVQYCAKQCSSNLGSLAVFTSRDPAIYCRFQLSKDLLRAHGVSPFLYNTKLTSLRLLHWHSVSFYLHPLVLSTKPWPFWTGSHSSVKGHRKKGLKFVQIPDHNVWPDAGATFAHF